PPRLAIHLLHLLYRFGTAGASFVQYAFYCSRNVFKADYAIQKRCHGDFIGGVESNGLCPTRVGSLIGQRKTRKFVEIRRTKIKAPQTSNIQLQLRIQSLRERESV